MDWIYNSGADTPSGEHEDLAEIKTKKLSRGEVGQLE